MSGWFYYARISTSNKQSLDRQLDGEELEKFCKRMNIDRAKLIILSDIGTGSNFDRPNYQMLKKVIRKGDNLIVSSIDRFGRNYIEGRQEFAHFLNIGARVYVLNRPMLEDMYKLNDNMSKFMANFLIDWELMTAEEELKRIKERQKQGIEVAKSKGKKFGRPAAEKPSNWGEVYNEWQDGKITALKAMELLGLKKQTFYNMVKKEKANNKQDNIEEI